jgi:hypothetical protein
MTPVDQGDVSSIPPDAPDGVWVATCEVKKSVTNKDKYPMLILNWTLEEALTDGNEGFAGVRVSDFVTFLPRNHSGFKASVQGLHRLCGALKIGVPGTASLGQGSWSDLDGFVEALEGQKATIYTQNKTQGTGADAVTRTNVKYQPHGRA